MSEASPVFLGFPSCGGSKKSRWRGTVQALSPSPYLADIEEQLLERRRSQLRAWGKKKSDQLELF